MLCTAPRLQRLFPDPSGTALPTSSARAAAYVAKSHRRAFIGAGLGIFGAMLVLGIALTVFRRVYLDSVPADVLPRDAAASLYDTVIRFTSWLLSA